MEDKLSAYLSFSDTELESLEGEIKDFLKDFEAEEIKIFLSGRYDDGNALLYVYSGAGGVDAQDWASILVRMYMRYAERNNFAPKLIEQSLGEQGGTKRAAIEIKGRFAYGLLKGESGVHRLVRISPYSAKQLRHTSFALVEVMPEISPLDLRLDNSDLKIETFRSSGPGGQHMQKTESAVRVTHKPTGITAEVQSERSQAQNKEKATTIVASRLAKIMEEQHLKELSDMKAKIGPGGIEWGSQIRSYVLHPYKQVKDHRTDVESHNPDDVLDGNLQEFIERELTM